MKNIRKRPVIFAWAAAVFMLVVSACGSDKITLEHIHGISYSSDGKQILIPAHSGLVAYSEGKWSNVDAPKHDYMGFSAVDAGFYSSGHPAAGSGLPNPLGVVKSEDGGKSIEQLGLEGESDFHGMAVGFKSHAIYVLNSAPNSKMNAPGLYYSTDDGKTWTPGSAGGLDDAPAALAAHPVKENVLAVGTRSGVYLSSDYGNQFEKILPGMPVASLYFSANGSLYAVASQYPKIVQYDTESKSKTEHDLPELSGGDAVSYMAQHPENDREMVVATFEKDVYLTKDGGKTWTKIADKGKAS